MQQLLPYHLYFNGGLHVGVSGVNLEEAAVSIPSDTIFSALLSSWAQLGESVEQWIEPFRSEDDDQTHPPFLLTSAFPFIGGLRFYPLPASVQHHFQPDVWSKFSKNIKRVHYISETLLMKMANGEKMDAYLFPLEEYGKPFKGAVMQEGALWFLLDEIDKLPPAYRYSERRFHAYRHLRVWKQLALPHVTLNRTSSRSTLFYSGRVVYNKDCGLWFAVQWTNPKMEISPVKISYKEAFEKSLKRLSESGLGGERSSGNGSFHYEVKQLITNFKEAECGDLVYLLSRCLPSARDLPDMLSVNSETAYQIVNISGWLQSPVAAAQRRKKLSMFREGSLVVAANLPLGSIVDIRPAFNNPNGDVPHPVYRSGFGLPIPWGN